MNRKRRFLINTLMLTVTGLMTRMIGLGFQAWLAGKIGASGIGLYQLIGSVTVLFSTIAISGIRFTATRLISEEVGLGRGNGVRAATKQCLRYALFFGVVSGVTLYLLAQPIGFLWIEDARTVQALKITAFAMPAVSLSAVFSGYFTASGRVWKAVAVQLFEQTVAVCLVISFLNSCDPGNLEAICSAVAGGNAAAGLAGLLFVIPIYTADSRKGFRSTEMPQKLFSRMCSIAMPLALSSYTKTALSTLEHLLIPRGLRLSGLQEGAALSRYGLVHGMALPAILFPACLLFAMAELIVPELTEAQMQGNTCRMIRIIDKARFTALLYAAVTGTAIMLLSKPIANHIYHTPQSQRYILLLAPLAPAMNLDTITDACLRGLGKQRQVMQINVLDAALGVFLVWKLIPGSGISGYIEMIWITECVNLLFSSLALHKALKVKKSSGITAGG